MKASLQLKLGQHLTLTPQLQQSIRLLQLSTLELNQEIEQILQENPLLEMEDGTEGEVEDSPASGMPGDGGASATPSDTQAQGELASSEPTDWNDDAPGRGGDDEDEPGFASTLVSMPTLREHLLSQASLLPLPPRDYALLSSLIEAINEEGYLETSLEEMVLTLDADPPVEMEELEIALHHLHHLDPSGVGARTLSECLKLQLLTLPETTPARADALRIAENSLDLLAARDVGKIKKHLRLDDSELRAARQLILSLNPKPGNAFGAGDVHYVIPDVLVRKIKGVWMASLNPEAMPRLRVNRLYADILSRHRESAREGAQEGASQLSSRLQEAKWLIKNIQQRFDTILRVSQAIVDRQKNFLEHGEVAMRPLVLREIADVVELHESTISRVTTQKFMMTPRGLFELKYFFGSHVATETGGACSSTAIRALIKQMIAAENPKSPLADGKIAELLAEQGIVVARRTVAKYREGLLIPTANLRKTG